MARGTPNRLAREKSPYLLQHANNPVDWYPWDERAFDRAEREDKPIFLSIGYSTCHWCHVMERESFEDPEVARLLNEVFVCIKVDREERPDLDHIYMTVCQMLTGSGGWPLTILMTAEKKPFFAGTYIPKTSRLGRTGLMELVPRIRQIWQTRRSEIQESAEKILSALKSTEADSSGPVPGEEVLKKAFAELGGRYDREFGGFSGAPKFPTPHNLLFLLRYWKRFEDRSALAMVEKTLQIMRLGGVYDHVGYGFHRYATDREWLVPHFEKMLYDQALLALAFLDTYLVTGNGTYADTAQEIFAYVLRDMTSPEGGFYSAEDADSEGEEGKFYVWRLEEIRELLPKEEADIIIAVFNVRSEGNYHEEATMKRTGANILHLRSPLAELAPRFLMGEKELADVIRSARKRLLDARDRRVRPQRDDKILTDWNGLMIAALSRGAQVLGDAAYARAAEKAADFILRRLVSSGGRLLHRYRAGSADITAHLDDYAFAVWGLIELYQTVMEVRFLEEALRLNQQMLEHYWDDRQGGLFFTPDDGERLIVRKKEIYDGAVPSGNSIALLNLLRLSRMTGRGDLEDKAEGIFRAFSGHIAQMPSAYTQFLLAADFALGPAQEVVVAGRRGASDTEAMLKALRSRFLPNQVLLFRPAYAVSTDIDRISEVVRDRQSIGGKATAYVCRGSSCLAPTTDLTELLSTLEG